MSLTLLLAAGLGVTGPSANARGAAKAPRATKHHAKSRHSRYTLRVRGQRAPEPARISEIQAALAKDGSFSGKSTGKWDASTVAAMKTYQQAHGLNPTGKLDAKTLQSLGLGSQTAGLAPPIPPVNSSSLSTSPQPSVPHKR